MPRTFGAIPLAYWEPDSPFRKLPSTAQWLYMALVSQPNLSLAGMLPEQPRRWSRLCTNLDEADVGAALDALADEAWICRDGDTEELLLRPFIADDGGWRTPNIRKGITRSIAAIASPLLRAEAQRALDAVTHPPTHQEHLWEGHQETRSETLAGVGSREEGVGSREEGARSAAQFDAFWQTFGHKVGKGAAEKAFAAALRVTDLETLLDAARRHAERQAIIKPERPIHAATWLNQRRWEDDPPPPPVPARKPSLVDRARAKRAAAVIDVESR